MNQVETKAVSLALVPGHGQDAACVRTFHDHEDRLARLFGSRISQSTADLAILVINTARFAGDALNKLRKGIEHQWQREHCCGKDLFAGGFFRREELKDFFLNAGEEDAAYAIVDADHPVVVIMDHDRVAVLPIRICVVV